MSPVNSKLQKVPEGYKQTEVGIIPFDWNLKTLKEIASTISVGLVINPSSYFDERGTVPMLVGSTVSENQIDIEKANLITEASNRKIPASRLSAGDLVTVRVGEPGITAVIPPELDGCNCASMMIVRKKGSFNSNWLCFLMNSSLGLSQIRNVQYGTAQKQFNISDAVGFLYPYPELVEQTAIANALSDVDALITSLEKLIDKKRAIKTAAMQQLLTGKKRLPPFDKLKIGYKKTELGEIPQDWEVRTIQSISLMPIQNGLFYEPSRKGRGVSLINVGDLYKSAPIDINALELFDADKLEISTFRVTDGDLFFTRSSIVPSGIAYCNIYDTADFERDVVFDSHLIRVRVNAAVAEAKYIYLACMSNIARRFLISSAKTATMTTIDQGAIKSCPILLPPKAEQVAIAGVLSDMDKEIAALENRLNKTQQIKQGMMQELLTGRTRLV